MEFWLVTNTNHDDCQMQQLQQSPFVLLMRYRYLRTFVRTMSVLVKSYRLIDMNNWSRPLLICLSWHKTTQTKSSRFQPGCNKCLRWFEYLHFPVLKQFTIQLKHLINNDKHHCNPHECLTLFRTYHFTIVPPTLNTQAQAQYEPIDQIQVQGYKGIIHQPQIFTCNQASHTHTHISYMQLVTSFHMQINSNRLPFFSLHPRQTLNVPSSPDHSLSMALTLFVCLSHELA